MAESDLEKAKNKLLEDQYYLQERYESRYQRQDKASEKSWNLHMQCYLTRNHECVQDYDKLLYEEHKLGREEEETMNSCFKNCTQTAKISEKDSIRSMDDLNNLKDHVSCLRSCLQMGMQYMDKKLDMHDITIARMAAYLKKPN